MHISHEYKSPNFDSREGAEITAIVLHATVGSAQSAINWLCNPASDVSSHYVITKSGIIYQLVADEHRAWHAGVSAWQGRPDVNDFSISIELENSNSGNDPYPLAQLASLRALVSGLLSAYRLTPEQIITHAQCALPQGRKTDPAGFPLVAFRASLQTPTYSPASPLIGAPLASALRWSGAKSAYDVIACKIITNAYWAQAQRVGLDPILAFAQCLHETGNLTSWWCQRPRRNPAGIGVTGQTSAVPHSPDWAYNPKDVLWHAGLSFASWADDAIPAHLGRLLGYAIHPKAMSDAQRDCYQRAVAQRPLPPKVLGSAPTIKQLGRVHNRSGLGWSDPGEFYGRSIAMIANSILEVA